jgi:hypothetical protein
MRRALGAACAVACAVACGGSSTVNGTYTIAFQSTEEAVATASVHVLVFDATKIDAQETCAHLLELRASHQDLPPAIVDLAPVSPCALSGGGSFSAPFGVVAVMVIGQAKGQAADLVRGCATQRLSADVASLTVEVALVPGMSIPATTCTSFSQKCGGGC